MKKATLTLTLVALLGVLPASAQVDFSSYCALGDSLTAGIASGSLHQDYQNRSYPALLAEAAGAGTFEMPLIAHPGLAPILELVSLDGPVLAPTTDPPPADPFEYFMNVTYPGIYNNLGVPGANLYDMLFTTGDINNLVAGNFDNPMHDLILRNGTNSAIEQCIGLAPTFVTMFIGNNDELGAALYGTPIEGVTMTPLATFELLYGNALGALVTNTAADIVVVTLPYATAIPFVTTVDPYVDIEGLGRWYLVSDNGVLTDDHLVTLGAASLIPQGYGLPGGPPLPDDINLATGEPGYVLRPDEVATINDRIDAFNNIIRTTADAFGVPVYDFNGWFQDLVAGHVRPFGSWQASADFLVGGFFSYDGIHPQNLGYAVVTVDFIDFINETFGAEIPQINMEQAMCQGGCAGQGVVDPDKVAETRFSPEALQHLYEIFPLLGPLQTEVVDGNISND